MRGSMAGIVTVATAIVGFMIVSVAVTSTQLSGIIKALGDSFSGALKAATGKG